LEGLAGQGRWEPGVEVGLAGELVPAAVPGVAELVSHRAAAVDLRPRRTEADVEDPRVDRVAEPRSEDLLLPRLRPGHLVAPEERRAHPGALRARGEDRGQPSRGADATRGQHRDVDHAED